MSNHVQFSILLVVVMRGSHSEAQVGRRQPSDTCLLCYQSNPLPACAGVRVEGLENHQILSRDDAAINHTAGRRPERRALHHRHIVDAHGEWH